MNTYVGISRFSALVKAYASGLFDNNILTIPSDDPSKYFMIRSAFVPLPKLILQYFLFVEYPNFIHLKF